jgi:hypothetical protein
LTTIRIPWRARRLMLSNRDDITLLALDLAESAAADDGVLGV